MQLNILVLEEEVASCMHGHVTILNNYIQSGLPLDAISLVKMICIVKLIISN